MTTTQVIARANAGGLSTTEIDLEVELRRNVIPQFFADVDEGAGRPWWRRQVYSLSVVANTRSYTLPEDFGFMEELRTAGGGKIAYVGESDDSILAAELGENSSEDVPAGYYVLPKMSGSTPLTLAGPQLSLTTTPTSSFTAKGIYQRTIDWADDTTEVNLDLYVPLNLQYALVELLRAQICKDRYGQGDKRTAQYLDAYSVWIRRARLHKHPARQELQYLMR
jgi:hypothetical protein